MHYLESQRVALLLCFPYQIRSLHGSVFDVGGTDDLGLFGGRVEGVVVVEGDVGVEILGKVRFAAQDKAGSARSRATGRIPDFRVLFRIFRAADERPVGVFCEALVAHFVTVFF